MNWRISIILLALFFSACKEQNNLSKEKKESETSYLIEANTLIAIANRPDIKIIDFRKKDIYNNQHIEGALNIWRTDIEDASYNYGGMMASKAQIETLFSKLGIASNDTIIIYDDNGLCDSTRLWWVLQNYDFKNVRLLHGGINSWKIIGGKVTNKITVTSKSSFKLTDNPKMKYYVSKEQVIKALDSNNSVILDTRTSDEFSGKRQKKGAAKSGRIPNSIHIDWAEAVNYTGDKRLKTVEDLEIIYNKLNIKKNDPIILYCHSGVRSAHTTFVLTQLLGYKNVKNYDGSWTEWGYFNHLPIEKDSITTIKN